MPLRSRGTAAWILSALALTVALCAPLEVELHPKPELSLGLWALGVVLTALGLRGPRLFYAVGALILWIVICACLFTQVSPFSLPPGSLWGPRGFLITSGLLLWLWLHAPAEWLWRGAAASGIATLYVLAMLIISAPPIGRTVSFTWLAADSRGRLYATEADLGVIWVFDPDGTRSNLWPRRAVLGKTGPGLLPSGFGSELVRPLSQISANNGGLTDANLTFCGIAVDAQDQFYMVDAGLHEVRRYNRDGQLADAWKLPDYYGPARGCVAVGGGRVFASDGRNVIHVYSADGSSQAHWSRPQTPRGLAIGSEGLWVLQQTDIAILDVADGSTQRTLTLPKPAQGLTAPYQTLVLMHGGGFLLSDANLAQVRRFAVDGRELAPLGKAATAAGQFAGVGGWPGEIAAPAGAAEDTQGRIYVADSAFRVIQRFGADGVVDAVYAVPEQEATEMRPILP